jgi:penicillin amidase
VTEQRIVAAGLQAPAEILLDPWGIPHIRAANLRDLFFAQGFNAARDRLWQIDLWRKRGLGLLAADFGPGYLAQDEAARLFLYRGDMAAEWRAYAEDAEEICTAFVAGINAYVALTERDPALLPPEFALLGTRPARWAAEDVVRIRSHAMTRNARSELLRADVLARADLATDALRQKLEPPIAPRPAEGPELGALGAEVLAVLKLATAPVTFSPERLAAPLADAWRWREVTELGEVVRAADPEGSNNWAVHGSRTETGRPILANDPHRAHAIPALRYLVHLTAPGLDVIGAGEPAVPGISLGHNGRIAFGLTIFSADQEDVYVYETEAGAPDRYRYRNGWETMTTLTETFRAKGCPDQVRTLRFTRHGPVVAADAARRVAVAVRSVWQFPGAAAYLGSLSSMRAGDFDSFRTALRRWGTPSVNHVFADVSGTIAWLPRGFTPARPNWDGLLPVPGDGRYEWDGLIDPDRMPCVVNPAEGFVATANEMNLPPDWPHERLRIGHEWHEPSRAARIRERLAAIPVHRRADSEALQTDVLSMPARRLCALLGRLAEGDEAARRGLALLRGWDCRLTAESGAAALFELWWTRHLRPAVLALAAPDPDLRRLLLPGDTAAVLDLLERPDARFGAAPEMARDDLLRATLVAAVADATARLGPDPADWAWGRLHHGYFQHQLSLLGKPAELDCGPLPIGGSGSTPMHTGYRPEDFRAVTGASVRLVIDVGGWDNSTCINAPGQSGDPRSPHYRDLAPLWAEGRYVPLLYSRAAVEAAATQRIILQPADPA